MSIPIIVAAGLFVFVVVSSFGSRLPADRSPLWWIFLAFILVAAWFPLWLRPVADFLRIELVSNLVLASAVLFLVFQLFLEIGAAFGTAKALRQVVAGAAAREFLAARRARETSGEGEATAKLGPRVLVVVPCHNEEVSGPEVARRLSALASSHSYDFCFVDDGSTDRTASVLGELVPGHVVSHLSNVGVSGVLMTGFTIARHGDFDYVVQCDGDGQHPIEEIPRLIERAEADRADLVIGSRFAASQSIESTTVLRRLGSLILVIALRVLFPSTPVADPTSGFRAYSRRASLTFLRAMPERYPEPETIALASRAGLKVVEVPTRMAPRMGGTSSLTGMKTAMYMIRVISALLGLRLRSIAGS